MKLNDFALALLMGFLGAVIIIEANGFPEMAGMAYGPEFFPTILGIGFLICGAFLAITAVRSAAAGNQPPFLQPPAWFADKWAVLRVVTVLAVVVFFVVAADSLGFLLTTGIGALVSLTVLSASKIQIASISLAFPLAAHFVFSSILRVPLPRGVIEKLFF